MRPELDGVLLSDGKCSVFLHPPNPYPDGHGFHHQVDIVAGPFQGSIDNSSYEAPNTLRHFHQELAGLGQSLKGKAELPNSFTKLKLSLTGDGLGHVIVEVDLCTGDRMEISLRFSFNIDQTYIPTVMADVSRLFLNHF